MVILFQFVPVRGTNLFETLAIPNEIRKLIDNYARGETVPGAKRDTDIENYLTDIHRYGNEPPESGDATDLGKHTLNRHWQLKMAGRDTPNRESTDDFDTMRSILKNKVTRTAITRIPNTTLYLTKMASTSSVPRMNILSWSSAPTILKTNQVQKLKTKPTSP